MKIMLESFKETIIDVCDFIINHLYLAYKLINFALPFFMYWIAIKMYQERGYFAIGGELFIPLLVWLITTNIHRIANKLNKGDSIPVPRERFIRDEGNGEYTMDQNRVQEMMIYVAEVEEYLTDRGMLK